MKKQDQLAAKVINVGGCGQGEGWEMWSTLMFEGVTDLNVVQCNNLESIDIDSKPVCTDSL